MGQCQIYGIMRNTTKGISEVKPRDEAIFLVAFRIRDDGLEGECVLVATFVWTSALLIW